LRIVQANPFHFPYRGGIEHRVHEVSRRLAERHEVIVLTSRLDGTAAKESMDGYEVVRLPSRFAGRYNPPYVSTPGVLEALNELDADVVDFHYRWAPSWTKAMRAYGGKWQFTFHNTYGEGQGAMRAISLANDGRFRRALAGRKVVCVTDFVRRDLISRGFDPSLLEVVPSGINVRERSGTDGGFILFTGRLVATKGLRYLIDAMRAVESELVVMGDGPLRRKLESRAAGLGNVRFAGHVDEAEKDRLMSSCSVFVMPSIFESLGLAVAEAMSWGKPVVASSAGGLPEVVGDGGVLVPPKDAAALSSALNELMGDAALRAELGAKAKKHIEGCYDWDVIARDMESSYRRTAEG